MVVSAKKRILVVAADAGAARFFTAEHRGGALTEREDRALQASPPAERAKPPRVHDRFGPARHVIEARQPPRAAAEAQFLKRVAESIEDGVENFDEIIVCAPPRALGLLRANLGQAVRQRLRAEIAKDFAHETPSGLAQRLKELAV